MFHHLKVISVVLLALLSSSSSRPSPTTTSTTTTRGGTQAARRRSAEDAAAADVINILAVGDSMVEYMGQSLESFCQGSVLWNAGIEGTTALEWASYTVDDVDTIAAKCPFLDNEDSSLAQPEFVPWDVVYISVGGNDLIESGCTLSAEEMKLRIEAAIENIVQNLAPGALTYVLAGYCMPTPDGNEYINWSDSEESNCQSPSDYKSLMDAIFNDFLGENIDLPQGTSLQVVHSIEACGGSTSSFSREEYFQDPIHLNAFGYCEFFSKPALLSALQCQNDGLETYYNCAKAEIYGLENNCITGDGKLPSSFSQSKILVHKVIVWSMGTLTALLMI
jgi:hypothetical protein